MIICGPIEIDGYAFCLGLKLLDLPYTASPELHSVPSLIYLIERAGLRPKYTANSLGRFSLEIRYLAELIDMFHTRKATDVRDKVYALLGMSSDNSSEINLQPDYNVSWKELFQQVVKLILGKDVSVETSDHSQRAMINSKGYILGQVSSVKRDDRQSITITSKNTARYLGHKMEWTLQASAKSIQEGDIVCLLQGALKPTIIRLHRGHFAIIVIAATPLNENGSFGQLEFSSSITYFPREVPLVWDWEKHTGESQEGEEYETLTKTNSRVLGPLKEEFTGYSDKATRIWNVALVLGDVQEYRKAEKRLREAVDGYETAFREEDQYILKSQYSQTQLWWAAGKGHEAVVKLLLKTGKIYIDSKDGIGRTPLSWAAEGGHEAVVKLLLETSKVDADSRDQFWGRTPLSWAAGGGHKAVVKLLLETSKVNINSRDNSYSRRTPLLWAAEGGHEAVVELLLETGKVDADSKDGIGQTPLLRAAERGHEAVVKLLLEKGMVDVDSKDHFDRQTPLLWAAERGHEAVVKLLLDTDKVNVNSKNRHGQTPLLWATERGHEAVVKLLLKTGKADVDYKSYNGRTPLLWAVEGRHEAVVKLLLETGKVDADSRDKFRGRTPLSWAAGGGHEAMVKLLLETGKVDVDSRDKYYGRTPLSWAAEKGHEAVVELLLETGKVDFDSKDNNGWTPLLWAMERGHEAIVKLLVSRLRVKYRAAQRI